MLRSLRIENLVLIRQAELVPAAGLNAITGETGAGKTILAHAFGLLLGQKGDAAAVGPGASEAYVEAEFDVPEGFFDDEELTALAELAPEDEAEADQQSLVLARRVFARRAHARLRLGPRGRAGGPRRRDRAARRDVGTVRAAPAGASLVPARRARRVLRRGSSSAAAGRHAPRGASSGRRAAATRS